MHGSLIAITLVVLEEIQGRHESRSIDVDLSIDDDPKDPHLFRNWFAFWFFSFSMDRLFQSFHLLLVFSGFLYSSTCRIKKNVDYIARRVFYLLCRVSIDSIKPEGGGNKNEGKWAYAIGWRADTMSKKKMSFLSGKKTAWLAEIPGQPTTSFHYITNIIARVKIEHFRQCNERKEFLWTNIDISVEIVKMVTYTMNPG